MAQLLPRSPAGKSMATRCQRSPQTREKKIETLTSFSPRASTKVKLVLPSLTCRFLPKNPEKQLQSLKKRQRARRRTVHSNAPKRPKHVFFFFNNSKFGIYRKLVCQAFVQNIARRGPVIEVRAWRARSWLSNGLKLFKDSGSYHELHTKRWATSGTTLKYSAELFVHARAAVHKSWSESDEKKSFSQSSTVGTLSQRGQLIEKHSPKIVQFPNRSSFAKNWHRSCQTVLGMWNRQKAMAVFALRATPTTPAHTDQLGRCK